MQAGDIVKIYQKPITKEDFEGKARLVEQYREDDGDGLSIWFVHFLTDYPEETYLRTIYEERI